jgi:hypothetical protein
MASNHPSRRPKRPNGINPKTGKPYEPVKRGDWDKMLKRAAKSKG